MRGLLLAGVLALAGFVVANPYAVLDFDAFRDGLSHQSEASGDGGGKLGLSTDSGIVYYLGTATWGLGWLPAAGGARRRDRRCWSATARLAAVLVPAPLLFLAFMGIQDRFFARWLLPVYPLLCLLAAWAVVRGGRVAARRRACAAARAGRGVARRAAVRAGARLLRPQRPRAAPAPTRASSRATGWSSNVPIRSKVVIEPFVPAAWAADAAERHARHGQRLPLEQVADHARAGRRWAAA